MNIITGEKIQNLCDYYIGPIDDFNFNPNIKSQISKQINIDNYNIENIKKLNIKKIFCYTHIIDGESANFSQQKCKRNKDNLINLLLNISTSFDIIFHNSDAAFKYENKYILQIPNLKKIYTQNLSIEPDERIIPLPIGKGIITICGILINYYILNFDKLCKIFFVKTINNFIIYFPFLKSHAYFIIFFYL